MKKAPFTGLPEWRQWLCSSVFIVNFEQPRPPGVSVTDFDRVNNGLVDEL